MAKVPHSGEEHRKTGFIRCGYHLFVPDRTARLDHGGRPRFYSGKKPVGEGEEGVGGDG